MRCRVGARGTSDCEQNVCRLRSMHASRICERCPLGAAPDASRALPTPRTEACVACAAGRVSERLQGNRESVQRSETGSPVCTDRFPEQWQHPWWHTQQTRKTPDHCPYPLQMTWWLPPPTSSSGCPPQRLGVCPRWPRSAARSFVALEYAAKSPELPQIWQLQGPPTY